MIIIYILIVLLVVLDYVLKIIFSSMYMLNEVETIIPNILRLGYIQNTGASFGLFEGQQFLFFIITLIALTLFGYFISKGNLKDKKLYTISFAILIAGTLGNAIDRILYGYVIDYIQVPFLPFVGHTFFNLADALLNVGIGLLVIEVFIIDVIRNKKKKLKNEMEDHHESN